MHEYASRVQRREGLLDGCFGFMDGLNLPLLNPGDPLEQNGYYNGCGTSFLPVAFSPPRALSSNVSYAVCP